MIIAVKLNEITTSCKYVLYINDFLIIVCPFLSKTEEEILRLTNRSISSSVFDLGTMSVII